MDAERDPFGGALEELGSRHAGAHEIGAERVRHFLANERRADLIEKDASSRLRLGMLFAERNESAHDVVAELPRARLVRLGAVEHDHAAIKIEVAPPKPDGFAVTHPLAREEAVEDAALQRHVDARHKRRVLNGVDERHGATRRDRGQEPIRQRMALEDLARVDSQREDAMNRLPVVAQRGR